MHKRSVKQLLKKRKASLEASVSSSEKPVTATSSSSSSKQVFAIKKNKRKRVSNSIPDTHEIIRPEKKLHVAKRDQQASKHGQNQNNHIKSKSTKKSNKNKSKIKSKKNNKKNKFKDPSEEFLQNPLQAPLIREAQKCFSELKCSFKITLGPTQGWRTLAKLAVRGTPPAIGLFAPGTHKVLPMTTCRAHHPSINVAVNLITKICLKLNVPGYDGVNPGGLSYIMFAVERNTRKVQLSLIWNSPDLISCQPFLDQLITALLAISSQQVSSIISSKKSKKSNKKNRKKISEMNNEQRDNSTESITETHPLWHSIWAHPNPASRHDNCIIARIANATWTRLFGPADIQEAMLPELEQKLRSVEVNARNTEIKTTRILPKLVLPPQVFRQANFDGFAHIVRSIREYIPAGSHVVELYGGVGTIGLNLIDLAASLDCSDENPYNIACFNKAKHTLSSLQQSTLNYRTSGAAEVARKGYLNRIFRQFNNIENNVGKTGGPPDIVIVDPPRKGLDEEVLEALLTSPAPRRLIYVSCGFKAFKRDAAILLGKRINDVIIPQKFVHSREVTWNLIHAEGHVLFPGANHLETLAIFDSV